MPLSWNEIKTRASSFVLEWSDSLLSADKHSIKEKAEAQTFETEFLKIFGVERKKAALFEHEVRFGDGEKGYIDLFWKGHIIIEMKTPGKDLNKAYEQAKAYALTLPQKDIPRGIVTCDFLNFQYYDLEEGGTCRSFTLKELPSNVGLFGFLAGYREIDPFRQWDPVNIEAAEKMGKLHNRLKDIGYRGHQLELYLVRLMFCLFADDTGIFEPPNIFNRYIIERTSEDGSDLALHIQKIFETLNKPKDKRLLTIDEQLNIFPYVNGHLFEETIETADFDLLMRDTLIECCTLDWSKISPAIFGAMFQSVMNDEERHDIGAHYTSEENILKLIRPLFLDGLWEEFNKIKNLSPALRRERLVKFHGKLAALKFLDPACGCGNFLVISYRELRLLELEVLEILLGKEKLLDIHNEIKVNVNQFYGIEIEEFPAQIAQVALWLVDHQMNLLVRERFGTYFVRIPLTAAASIHHANALAMDWESVIPKTELSYILGNPPFLGASVMSKEQKKETEIIFDKMNNFGILDYVTCWYKKAAQYIQGTEIEVAFVSTNSICQGEQVPALWPELMNKHGIKINFAHQTFKWSNEARGKAAVYCVIIGFSLTDRDAKKIYQYASVTSEPGETVVKQINAYLVNAPIIFIEKRNQPLCNVPKMVYGNKPTDDGNLFLNADEYDNFILKEPNAKKYIRKIYGSEEYINNKTRYCLWLVDAEPSEIKKMPLVMERIEKVKRFRLASTKKATRDSAKTPAVFQEIRQPKKDYIIIPRHSSENRDYIPIGFVSSDILVNDAVTILPDATVYDFGILTSTMHMAWVRYVCGRIKSDYRYSNTIVYNNFPFPVPSEKQKMEIEKAAQNVLDVRTKFQNSSLADLYDPVAMPPVLLKAHQKLDKAVEASYGRTFTDDSQRVAFLFELYQKLTCKT
ncbi:MAG: hypothetical protein FWH35_01720 [Treponema sp.]|nr:hypothetical protein [Treponema sp.]